MPMYTAAASGRRRGSGPLRPALHAQLCLAKLRGLSELRRRDLSEAVFADGLAVHRPVLPLSASSAGMAEGDAWNGTMAGGSSTSKISRRAAGTGKTR